MAIRSPVFGGLTIPGAASLNAVAAPRALVAAGARSLVPVTYGTDRVPALILNVLVAAGQPGTLLVQCLWGHACDAIDELRLNDQALPAGATVVGHYTGSQLAPDSALFGAFAAQGITYTDALETFAYSVVAMPVGKFDGQLAFSARIRGRRVYDRRKDSTAGGAGPHRLASRATWEHSENPALCLADWTADNKFGAGEPVHWASVPAAADACDEFIGSPAEKRRLLGVTLTGAASVAQVAEAMRAYAGCWLVPSAAGLRLVPDRDAAPVASYSHAAGQIAAMEPLGLRDLGNMPTAVEVVYTDTSQIPWRDASVDAKLPGAGVTLPWRLSSVRLPGVQRASQALREATERLNKLSLSDLSTTVEVFDGGVAHDVADIITLTHPLGVSAKPMRVTAVEMPGPGRWRLSVAEHDPAAYSDLVQTAPTYADTNRVTIVVGEFETVEGAQAKADAAQAAAIAAAAATGAAINSDPTCTTASAWESVGSGYSIQVIADGIAGPSVWRKVLAGGNPYVLSNRVAIDRQKTYRAKWWIRKSAGADGVAYPAIALHDGAGALIAVDGTLWHYPVSQITPGVNWAEYVGTFGASTARPIPANAATISIGAFLGYDATTGYHEMQGVRLEEVTDLVASAVAAAADATAKANAAQAAAVSTAAIAAQAKADLAETTAKAYADGIVSTEESRAIADATNKANAAQAAAVVAAAADATAKANAAQAAAVATAAIAAQAKADLAETTAKAYADGKVSAEESRAIADATNKANAAQAAAVVAAATDATAKANAAQAAAAVFAQTKVDLAETTAKAYADGVVDAEEARAIEDATTKANAAQAAATVAAAADATAKANAAALTAAWTGVSGVSVTTGQLAAGAATQLLIDSDGDVTIDGLTGAPFGPVTIVNSLTFTPDVTADALVSVSGYGRHTTPSSGSDYATCRGALYLNGTRLMATRFLDQFTGVNTLKECAVMLTRRVPVTAGTPCTIEFAAQKFNSDAILIVNTEMRVEIIKR